MGKKYLIDTNVVIYLLKGNLPQKTLLLIKPLFESKINFSVINKIELLSHRNATPEENYNVEKLIDQSDVHPLNDSIADMSIEVRKKYSVKLAEAIIAATAIVHQYVLVTRNVRDFEKIPELETYNPFE